MASVEHAKKAEAAGLKVAEVAAAVKNADVVMMLLPDENIPQVYNDEVAPNMKAGAALAFAHGFNVHYNQVVPRTDVDVIMVAPKGSGRSVRANFLDGSGINSSFAVFQDFTGRAQRSRSRRRSGNQTCSSSWGEAPAELGDQERPLLQAAPRQRRPPVAPIAARRSWHATPFSIA